MDDKSDEYNGLNNRYVIYIVIGVVAFAGIIFLIQILGRLNQPVSPTGNAVYTSEILDEYLSSPDNLIDLFNKVSVEVPGTLKAIFGDEKVNAKITRFNRSVENLAIETENGNLKNVEKGSFDEPTMSVEISEAIIKKIYEAESPADEIEKALDTGEIKYDTNRFTSTVKMGILNAAVNVMSWFS